MTPAQIAVFAVAVVLAFVAGVRVGEGRSWRRRRRRRLLEGNAIVTGKSLGHVLIPSSDERASGPSEAPLPKSWDAP